MLEQFNYAYNYIALTAHRTTPHRGRRRTLYAGDTNTHSVTYRRFRLEGAKLSAESLFQRFTPQIGVVGAVPRVLALVEPLSDLIQIFVVQKARIGLA